MALGIDGCERVIAAEETASGLPDMVRENERKVSLLDRQRAG
jgi:hypothetical protein